MTINRNLSILAGGVSSTGVLGVPNGGSGAITLTGYLIGNGTGAFTASATIPTSALSGTLNIANGGTGQTTASTAFNALSPLTTAGDTLYGGVSGAGTRLGIGTAGQVLTVNSGATAPQWITLSGVAVTTFQTSLSGLTPSTATNGAVTLAGTLGVASGGTGATTLTGYVYGNGIGAMTASTTIPTSALSGTVNLTSQVSGILPIANGGTAQTSFTANQIHYGSFSTSAGLTFDGTNFATTGYASATSFRPTASTIPTNGLFLPTTNTLGFATNSAEIMRLFASGGVSIGNTTDPGATNLSVTGTGKFGTTIGVGAATPSTSGAGITFPATQSASTDVNTLDDYEEGDWTPNFSAWSIAPSVTYAKYTKIGRTVNLNMLCQGGVTVGGDVIGSLPFTSAGGQGASAVIRGINTNINAVGAISDGSTQIQNIGAMTNTGFYWVLSTCYIV